MGKQYCNINVTELENGYRCEITGDNVKEKGKPIFENGCTEERIKKCFESGCGTEE